MTQRLYWFGNAAKTRVIQEILDNLKTIPGSTPITVFDYGCGDGGDWPAILADHPRLRLFAYEPLESSCHKARERLRNYAAEIISGKAIDTLSIEADYIVSFSVFEHVVSRYEYLRRAKRILAPGGTFYLNYDDGHFRNLLDIARPSTWLPALRAWGRTAVSRPLAFFGLSSCYQRRVDTEEAERLVYQAGFRIERVYYHNLTSLKDLAKVIPNELRQEYVAWWLEVEKCLNERFQVHLSKKTFGDSCNLWLQMVSRILCLMHR